MKTRLDEVKEISKNTGMWLASYGNKIFLNYQDMGLAWLSVDTEIRLFTVTGYKCNIETEDLEVIRQQLIQYIK